MVPDDEAGIDIEISADLKSEIAARISHAIRAHIEMASTVEIESAIQDAIDRGLVVPDDSVRGCPNCGNRVTGPYCCVCNESPDEPSMFDHDPGGDEHDSESIGDHEDQDDAPPLEDREWESKFPHGAAPLSDRSRIAHVLEELGLEGDELRIGTLLIVAFLREGSKCARIADTPREEAKRVWQTLEPLLAEIASGVAEGDVTEEEKVGWETRVDIRIERSGEQFVPHVAEPFEGARATGKRGAIRLATSKFGISPKLFLQKKRGVSVTLYKIGQAIMKYRVDFLRAPNRAEAERILRSRPLEQRDVAEFCGVDPATINRHRHRTIMTPHGLFRLQELFSRVSIADEGRSVADVRECVRIIFEEEKARGVTYTDEQARALLEEQGLVLSRERITKFREELGIPGSQERKRREVARKS